VPRDPTPGEPRGSRRAPRFAHAYLEMERLIPGCCQQRALAPHNYLVRAFGWATIRSRHGRAFVDDDQTGPATHPGLAVLALVEFAAAYPDVVRIRTCTTLFPG